MYRFGCRLKSVAVSPAALAQYYLPARYRSDREYQQAFSLGQTLTPRTASPAYTKADLAGKKNLGADSFERPWVVELGSGTGEFLLHAAAKDPQKIFVGVDAAMPCTERSLCRAEQAGLNNVFFYNGMALDFLDADFRGWNFSEIFINFPDPWPKKRHIKRRMVSPALAKAIGRALVPKGGCVTATDVEKLSAYHCEILDNEPALERVSWESLGSTREYYDFLSAYGKKNLAASDHFHYTVHTRKAA